MKSVSQIHCKPNGHVFSKSSPSLLLPNHHTTILNFITIFNNSHQILNLFLPPTMAATATPIKSFTPKKPSDTSISVSKVRVIVRVRPFLAHETSTKNGNPVSCISVLERDFEVPQEEVAVYLKDPQTRSHKVPTFGFFCW